MYIYFNNGTEIITLFVYLSLGIITLIAGLKQFF